MRRNSAIVGLGVGQRDVDLGAHHGQRRAQLVRGVGHEALLGLERRAEPVEHRVEGVGELGDLVVGAGVADPLVERLARRAAGRWRSPGAAGAAPARPPRRRRRRRPRLVTSSASRPLISSSRDAESTTWVCQAAASSRRPSASVDRARPAASWSAGCSASPTSSQASRISTSAGADQQHAVEQGQPQPQRRAARRAARRTAASRYPSRSVMSRLPRHPVAGADHRLDQRRLAELLAQRHHRSPGRSW